MGFLLFAVGPELSLDRLQAMGSRRAAKRLTGEAPARPMSPIMVRIGSLPPEYFDISLARGIQNWTA